MPATSRAYRAAVLVGTAFAPMLGRLNRKTDEGHRRRLGSTGRLLAWAAANRARDRPLVWVHAASVGEGLQAESVLLELRRLVPHCQLLYTHFSPSAEPLAKRLPVDAADYLPYDRPAEIEDLLAGLTPDLLVFAKLDLWPELATRAAARGVSVALVAGTVSAGSGRLRWPARTLLRPGYAAVSLAGAIAEDDAVRLARLGVPPDRIAVLGDPRYDSVVAKVKAIAPDDPLLRLGGGKPSLVAGSTWPPDERVLLTAFAALRTDHPHARLMVVPHEPTVSHLERLERNAVRLGLGRPARLSERPDASSAILVVDRVGVLAVLYGAGTMAYVGGGFGRAGLHSVLEPAAWGLPVAFGPRWRNSRDASVLLEGGAAKALTAGNERRAAEELGRVWKGWLTDEASRIAQGARARAIVAEGTGASARSAAMLAELISSRHLRT
jgi:3-deoxy-D-manno-octulosonic-acid transferase